MTDPEKVAVQAEELAVQARSARQNGHRSGTAGELAGRLDQVEAHLAEFHRRAAHRESVIDRLHEENQRLHDGIGRIILDPW